MTAMSARSTPRGLFLVLALAMVVVDNFKSVSRQCEEKMKNMSSSSNSSENSDDSNYEVFETNNEFECKKFAQNMWKKVLTKTLIYH